MNYEVEKQTAITKFAEINGVIPIKPRYNNKVILGIGMSSIQNWTFHTILKTKQKNAYSAIVQ